ncbi:LLM class F420-dependent oxidoreductase [Pseudonocardia kujensis]|uniref:LLM class F420-dependent oxidoreductase n=1 Tax=Pseudonocardia kujensis TaxID=1128675 RepID=UPI001E564E6F|nr:LLM class F420-dependent oxidoreductase [Pseudonocardia kujensis]MCE0767608.1 LLM class F420-dependent oxidoreductase [Pseudonocardia kujensis]
MAKPDLGRYGVFGVGAPTVETAREIERLGYGAYWVAGSPAAELDWAEPLLEATDTLCLATGIVNIWTADVSVVAGSFHRIDKAFPGRFLLGIGAGHPELNQEYRSPLGALNEYLDVLDAHDVPADRRVIAAQGPKTLRLAAARSAGAHPYLTVPAHTSGARELLGPGAFLAPEHKALLTTDVERARAIGRRSFATSIQKTNYRSSWKRIGFTEADLAEGGSDRLTDAVVAHGTVEQVAARLEEFHAAGADHVPVQILTDDHDALDSLGELARALGLGEHRRTT